MTLSDAAWQKQGEDHPVLFTREIVTHEEERRQNHGCEDQGRREGGREKEREKQALLLQF